MCSPHGEYPLKLGKSALLVPLADDDGVVVTLDPWVVPLPVGLAVVDALDEVSESVTGGNVRRWASDDRDKRMGTTSSGTIMVGSKKMSEGVL